MENNKLDFKENYYKALTCGQYNARSDWLRARSERS